MSAVTHSKFWRDKKMPESLSFYEDNYFEGRMSYDRSKLKLDLNSPSGISGGKRSLLSHVSSTNTPLSLQSPDLKMLKLGSPELEKIILKNGYLLATPTPTEVGDKASTDDPEQFARGFVEALQKLHENDNTNFRPLYDQGTERKQKLRNTKDSCIKSTSENQQVNGATYTNSFTVKSEEMKLPYSTTAPMSSASFSYVNNTQPYANVGIDRNTHAYAAPRTDGLSYPGTTSAYSTGYTYDESNRGLGIGAAENAGVLRGVSSVVGKATMPCTSMMPLSTALSVVDSSVSHSPPSSLPGPSQVPFDDGAQIVPSSSPPMPIDLTEQEKIKHERKKLRNRLAAQRCRKRKIEREEDLRIKVKDLKAKHSELTTTASELRLQVCELKEKVMNHMNQGCQLFVSQGSSE